MATKCRHGGQVYPVAHLVSLYDFTEILVALWVLIIRPHKHALLARWCGKGTNSGHDIHDHLPGSKHVTDSLVLCVEFRIPVDLGIVKVEDAAGLTDLDEQVIWPGQDFVAEGAELAFCANVVDFVDDGANVWVLVENDLANDLLVRKVLASDV